MSIVPTRRQEFVFRKPRGLHGDFPPRFDGRGTKRASYASNSPKKQHGRGPSGSGRGGRQGAVAHQPERRLPLPWPSWRKLLGSTASLPLLESPWSFSRPFPNPRAKPFGGSGERRKFVNDKTKARIIGQRIDVQSGDSSDSERDAEVGSAVLEIGAILRQTPIEAGSGANPPWRRGNPNEVGGCDDLAWLLRSSYQKALGPVPRLCLCPTSLA